MKKNFFKLMANNRALPEAAPLELHHPDAALEPVRYYLPKVFRAYAAGFPARVAELLHTTNPDRYNDDTVKGEIAAFSKAAADDLRLQQEGHRRAICLIQEKNRAAILEIDQQVEEIDRKIAYIDQALAQLEEGGAI